MKEAETGLVHTKVLGEIQILTVDQIQKIQLISQKRNLLVLQLPNIYRRKTRRLKRFKQ